MLATTRGTGADKGARRRAGWALPAGEVHVWSASLEPPERVVAQLGTALSGDERARADRFRFDRDRSRYIVGRGILRVLLGRYLGIAPEDVRFEYGAFEKPFVAGGPWFNLSHSGAFALYAFGSDAEIGIDVELEDRDYSRERIAERFFSTAEVAALRSLRPELQPRAFLTCWTRKEAFIKARGDGLSLALDSFDVSLAPDAPPALLRTAWSTDEPREWLLVDLSDQTEGYVAALALRCDSCRLVKRRVPETNEGIMAQQEDQ